MHKQRYAGYLILEVLMAIVFLSMVLLTIYSMIRVAQLNTQRSDYSTEASFLIQEGIEIASDNLKNNWVGIVNGTYHPSLYYEGENSTWILENGEEEGLQGRYKRKIEVSEVCRNPTTGEREVIVGSCEGVSDANSRLVTTTVEWQGKNAPVSLSGELLVLKTDDE